MCSYRHKNPARKHQHQNGAIQMKFKLEMQQLYKMMGNLNIKWSSKAQMDTQFALTWLQP